MNVLVFDTVLNKTFINFNGVSKVIESDEKNYHSVYLISKLKEVLGGENPDVIGVNIGPGSFTGIRVCLSVATVMAGQLDVPLVGVPSVEILSKAFEGAAVFLDARRGKYIYFDGLGEAVLIEKTEAVEFAKGKRIVADTNATEFFASEGIDALNYETAGYDLGAVLSELVKEKLKTSNDTGGDFHYTKVKPLYLQTPPIMIK